MSGAETANGNPPGDDTSNRTGWESLEEPSPLPEKLDPFWEKHPGLKKQAMEIGAPPDFKAFKEQGFGFKTEEKQGGAKKNIIVQKKVGQDNNSWAEQKAKNLEEWERLAGSSLTPEQEDSQTTNAGPLANPLLTPEQEDYLRSKEIYDTDSQEYKQALRELGIDPDPSVKAEENKSFFEGLKTTSYLDSQTTNAEPAPLINETHEEQPTSKPENSVLDSDNLRTKEYLDSWQGKKEAMVEAWLDKWHKEIQEKEEAGQITSDTAEKLRQYILDQAELRIDKIRESYVNGESGSAEDAEIEAAKQAEIEAAKQAEIEAAKQAEIEAAEEQERLLREWEQLKIKEALLKKPLIAINADFTHDKKELAHDLAENALNDEVAKGNFIKRLWKGTLFKKYYEQKYTNEFVEGQRKIDVNGEQRTVEDLVRQRKNSAIERFVLGATESFDEEFGGYVHKKAGEKLTEADKETTAAIKSAIEKFAHAKIPEGGSLKDLVRDFSNEISRIKPEARDEGKDANELLINNYLEVALQARKCVEHEIALGTVMEGFKVYNAEVRDGIRTEAHRDNIDKAVNWLEKHTGGLVPPQIMAGALSVVSAITQTGARAVAGAAGGMVVSSIISGLKERNRITEDRARMLRDAANGLEYSGTSESGEDPEGRRAKRIAKYEARIGGTLYDLQKAGDLADKIESALNSEGEGQKDAILHAIAEARVRIDLSDSEQKDLIAYSSADKRGEERLRLDKTVIRAEKALSSEDQEAIKAIKESIQKEIFENIEKSDSEFRRKRAALAAKKAGKTLALGAATFVVSQEIVAALDPGKIGLLEKAGILKTENNADASETLLAGLAGQRIRTETNLETISDISGDRQVEIEAYESAGYTKTETAAAWTETKRDIVDVNPANSSARINVKYDGWANNGTRVSDGNELRAYLQPDGKFVSGMSGNSTMGDQVINYEATAAAGRVKGYITVGGAKFELVSKVNDAGQLTWGDGGGVFTTTTGETIRAISPEGAKLYEYFEIAVDNGVDAEGLTHIIPLATDVGQNTFNGTIQQVTETIVEHPAIYNFTKAIVSEVPSTGTMVGLAFAPETARTGLGGTITATQPEQSNASLDYFVDNITSDDWRVYHRDYKKAAVMLATSVKDSQYLLDKSLATDENQTKWANWWNGLDTSGKINVRRVAEKLNELEGNSTPAREFILRQSTS